VFGDVAIGEMHIREQCLRLFVDTPTDTTHLGRITKAIALSLDLMLLMCAMDEIMTCLTERNEIVRAITTRLARLDMMHIQDVVF